MVARDERKKRRKVQQLAKRHEEEVIESRTEPSPHEEVEEVCQGQQRCIQGDERGSSAKKEAIEAL